MRFLLFNLIVAGALVYLLSDGGLSDRLRQSLALVSERLDGTPIAAPAVPNAAPAAMATPAPMPVSEPPAALADAAPATDPAQAPAPPAIDAAAPPAPAGEARPAPPTTVTATAAPAAAAAPAPAPVAPAATELMPTNDPAVQRRRAEVLGTAPSEAAATADGFMSPQLRRRELQVLSEEMELLFSQLIAR